MAVHEGKIKILTQQGDVYYHDCPETESAVIELVGDFNGTLTVEAHQLESEKAALTSTWTPRELFDPMTGSTGLSTITNDGSEISTSYYVQPMGQSIRITASTLNSGVVYVRVISSHGTGFFLANRFLNTVIVRNASQLQDIDSTKNYIIDGAVDMGSQSIVVPEGGISIGGLSGAREVSYLYSTEDNYTMFTTPSGGYAGNVFIENISIPSVTGVNSQVFSLNNDGNNGSFEILNVNFGGFGAGDGLTSLGSLSNYRQLFFSGCGFYFVNEGFTLNGDFSGMVVQDSNFINPTTAATYFIDGTDLVFSGSVRSNANFNSVNSSSVFADFSASNFTTTGAFSLNNFRTTADNAISNITGSSVYARFVNCEGIENTYRGGIWDLTTEVETTIAAIETPYKIAGTTTYNDLQHFESVGNNAIRYIGTTPLDVKAEFSFSFNGTNGDQIKVYILQWDNSASSYIEIDESGAITLNASGRAENVNSFGFARMEENDRIEFHVENYSAARNVTLLVDSTGAVQER